MAQLQSTSISGSLIVSGSNSKIALGSTSGISRIFTNSTNDIRFSTTNTGDVLFLKNSNGNVGIGTTSPLTNLHIANAGAAAQLSLERTDTSDTLKLVIGSSYGYLQNTNGPLSLGTTGGTQQVHIATDGDVGIGTTSPNQRLTVAGNISASGDLYLGSTGTGHIRTTGNNDLRLYPAGGGNLYLGDAGNGMRMYHYSDITAGQYTTYSWSGNYYTLGTSATNGIKFTSEVIMDGNLTVGGIVTAQEFHTEFVSASIVYSSGSTKFGDTLDDTHSFTGSLELTGSAIFSSPAADSVPLTLDSPISGVNVNFGFEIGDTGLGLHPKNLVIRGSSGASDIAFSPSTSYPGMMMLDGSTGNVGIGTTSPDDRLEIAQSNSNQGFRLTGYDTNSSENYRIYISSDGSSNIRTTSYIRAVADSYYYDLNSGGAFRVRSNTTSEILHVNNNGNVGIGTTSPATKLDVSGSIRMSAPGPVLTANSTNQQSGLRLNVTNLTSGADLIRFQNSGTTLFKIKENGNVGIGNNLTATEKLHISGGNVLIESDSGAELNLLNTASGVKWQVVSGFNAGFEIGNVSSGNTDAQASFFIQNSTNRVGIGTTNPTRKLHVSSSNNTNAFGIDIGEDASYQFSANSTSGYATTFHMDNTGLDIGHDSSVRSINLKTHSADRLTVAGGGNVGIGTTSPGTKLDVVGTIRSINSAANPTFNLSDNVNSNWDIELESATNSFKIDQNSGGFNTTALYIAGSTGNVGIGNSAPSNKLDVGGNIYVQNNGYLRASGSGALYLGNTNGVVFKLSGDQSDSIIETVSNKMIIQTSRDVDDIEFKVGTNAATSSMYIDATNAYVGIGTTSPSKELTVIGDALVSGTITSNSNVSVGNDLFVNGDTIIFTNDSAAGRIFSADTLILDADYDADDGAGGKPIIFRVAGDTKMTIDGTGGNVGIGTTSPSNLFHVNAGTEDAPARFESTDNLVRIALEDSSDVAYLGQDGANGIAFFGYEPTAHSNNLSISSSGYVGIGTTSPAYKLDVYSSTNGMIRAYGSSIARLSLQNSTRHFSTSVQGSNWLFYDETGGAERMRIDSSGRIGIGTTSPSSKLTVDGKVTVDHVIGSLITGSVQEWNSYSGVSGNTKLDLKIGRGNNNKVAIFQATYEGGGYSNIILQDQGGNVGIGTTSPTYGLHVNTDAYVNDLAISSAGDLTFVGNALIQTNNNSFILNADSNANGAGFISLRASNVERLKVTTSGAEVNGDLTVSGIVTAQEFHTEFVSASIVFNSGSTKFGDTADDVHSFTGSLEVLGGITGSIQVPAPSTPSVSAAEASDVINLSISSFDTSAERCEVYRSQTSSTTGFGLIAHIEEADIAASFSVTDDSYTANTQTWYRVYAVRTGKYSAAGTATVTPTNVVADVSNLSVRPFEEGFIITYDLPSDRRLESVTIKKQALATNTGFSEGSATTIYTGLANSYVYVYAAAEKDYYHKFWISTNTAT